MTSKAGPEIRSVPVADWPEPDRLRWEEACRPGERLKRGGAAAHLKPVTRDDLARRYGYFLHFLKRTGRSVSGGLPADQVTSENVAAYISELHGRGLTFQC